MTESARHSLERLLRPLNLEMVQHVHLHKCYAQMVVTFWVTYIISLLSFLKKVS
jgi:hypothetical protein